MHLQHARLSTNISIDCLGKETNVNSPEVEAALVCQHEVMTLRDLFLKQHSRTQNGFSDSFINPPDRLFEFELMHFMEENKKAEGHKSDLRRSVEHTLGLDSFSRKTKEFAEYLHLDSPY